MDISKVSVKDIKKMLENEKIHIPTLLENMEKDSRDSVCKLRTSFLKRKLREEQERERLEAMFSFETFYYNQGIYHIAGIDEAGRGPVAGPVMVAAVILPPYWECPGLNDSKKVSPKKREILYDIIMKEAVAVSCIAKSEENIDVHDIYHATQQGMYDAVDALKIQPQAVLIDAMPLPALTVSHRSIIKGDAKSASIAAASIIAKVTRDRLMNEYDKQYPQYGFSEHKGYLTQKHLEAIQQFGPCPIHRRSFEPIKSMTQK
ncbi:ribonuclease HII [Megasphaera paucivorans]|uniref:Ribonuclease HII n=1 Tax=Megasphaera paucivorans TaxID=349095 RepID=A0A1G9S6S3_9FIRM|nr:ribonuclease HII [Megasphaera paucivorans]SDM31218.1 RNase HII [Megasphaera paucivorans]